MPGWTALRVYSSQGRIFHRPLDITENYLLWGNLCDGAFDCAFRVELHLLNGANDAELFSDANIIKAWMSTKRRHPLIGATLQGPPASPLGPSGADSKGAGISAFASEPHFVVREGDLATLRQREIIFGHVGSAEEMDRCVADIFDGPPPLSQDLLTQLYVFRETWKETILHVMTLSMHCVTDLTADSSVMRCFLDTLARGGEVEPPQVALEDRLAMVTPSSERKPIQLRSLSPAKRRWRKAAASIIFQTRMEKMQGGHTLPCRLTSLTPLTPPRSRESFVFLTKEETTVVLANCRRHEVTFGNAYLILAQVAMTRVLYRRYLRGDMSEEEWEYRREQPQTIAAPISLRPYLDKTWFERGGGGEFVVSMGTFFHQLPLMALGGTSELYQPHDQKPGPLEDAPPLSELLTFERFLHRTRVLKNQVAKFFKHPLLLEIVDATATFIHQYWKRTTLDRLEHIEATKNGSQEDLDEDEDEDVLAPMDVPLTVAHGGSSFGNLDSVLPLEYPLPSTHPLSPVSSVPHPSKAGYVTSLELTPQLPPITPKGPKIVLRDVRTLYHTSPGELYLGAWSSGGRLKMYGLYDSNVYEVVVVKEWLDELKDAILWYLGRTHEPRQLVARLGKGRETKL